MVPFPSYLMIQEVFRMSDAIQTPFGCSFKSGAHGADNRRSAMETEAQQEEALEIPGVEEPSGVEVTVYALTNLDEIVLRESLSELGSFSVEELRDVTNPEGLKDVLLRFRLDPSPEDARHSAIERVMSIDGYVPVYAHLGPPDLEEFRGDQDSLTSAFINHCLTTWQLPGARKSMLSARASATLNWSNHCTASVRWASKSSLVAGTWTPW
jgi:hypothetical protein